MATGSKKVILAALIGNALVATTKFIAAALTGSAAMFSEGVHSVVDTGNQVLLLYGLRRSQRPPDEQFPFGHGKEIYFWCFVVAILIFAVGAGVSIVQGISRIQHPHAIDNPTVNYVVLALAMVFEGVAWYVAYKQFSRVRGKWGIVEAVHRGKDPSLFVVLFEDSAAMLGLLVAFVGVLLSDVTGILVFDGIASLVIGLILGATAIWLAYETKSLLIGESANKRVVDGIRKRALELEKIEQIHEVLTMHMGPDFILVNISVRFARGTVAGEIERTIAGLDRALKDAFPAVQRVFVEAERGNVPAEPRGDAGPAG